MNKHLLRISMIAALAASAIHAETYSANVPFDFVLGNKTVPAGKYVVDSAASSNVVNIRSIEHNAGSAVIGNTMTAVDYARTSKLVFHRYGNRYFLAEVWTRGSDAGRRLPETPQERELAAEAKIQKTLATVALR
jgi:hypothetical protein